MSADPDVLLDLAGAVADGTPVDWKAFGPPQDGPVRGVIEEMALLARIGELHRTFGNGPDGHESAWDEAPDREPPARWGDLRLLERVGAGMAGEVFRAYDDRLQREVALKLFYPDHDGTASSALTEGRLLARVRHPNVVTVFGVDEFDGRVGVWMEFIRGRTLADRVGDDGPLPVRNAVETGTQLCDALEAVHRAHLLHRDIKPQNVMLADDGRVVLMDFSAGGEQLRRDQDVAGTPLYLAPELFLGGTPSVQSDVYSAGVVLFHLLTAAHPVSGRNVAELQRAHQARTREPLKSFRPDLPSALANLIDRAISPVPQERFVSAEQMAGALRAAVRPSRWWRMASIAAVSAVVVAALGAWALREEFRQRGNGSTDSLILATGPTVQQLDWPGVFPVGAPSPDGAWLPATMSPPGPAGLVLLDPRTGRRREVANALAEPRSWSGPAVFSPDGRFLFYSWFSNTPGQSAELRTLDVASMVTKTIYRAEQGLTIVGRTSDPQRLLVRRAMDELAHFDVSTGTLSAAVRLPATSISVSLSPDGRSVLFDQPAAPGSLQRDVFVSDVLTWQPRPLVRHPSMDAWAVWLPDGNGVAFASDRSGTLGLWRLDVIHGRPVGDPVLVRPNVGKFIPIGFDRAGDLYYQVVGTIDVYIADVDLGRGGIRGMRPAAVSHLGGNKFSDWSPDGRHLVYVSQRGEVATAGSQSLVIRDLESDRERAIPTNLIIGNPRWSPDGQRIVLPADSPESPGAFVLTVADGRITPLLLEPRRPNFPAWMPDGRTLLFLRGRGGPSPTIHALDTFTRTTRPLVENAGRFIISRQGDRLAFVTEGGVHSNVGELVVWTVPTNERLELARETEDVQFEVVGWSPDDNAILVTRRQGDGISDTDLLVFPSRGGTSHLIGRIPGEAARNVRLDPSGTRISFEAGLGMTTAWVMRGFFRTGEAGR